MKRIYSILLAAFALLAFAPGVRAQDTQDYSIKGVIGDLTFKEVSYTESSNVGFSKTVSSPTSDGTYWIKLEAFATGSAVVTTTSTPSDVILVLDVSTSMTKNSYTSSTGTEYSTRLAALKEAAISFVTNIYNNDQTSTSADGTYAGNRIGIISFGGQVTDNTQGWVYVNRDSDGNVSSKLSSLTSTINNLNTGNSGTWTSSGLRVAIENYLAGTTTTTTKREGANLTVVVFTDGEPATGGSNSATIEIDGKYVTGTGANFSSYIANNAVYYANQLKNTYSAKVFTVTLLGSNPDTRVIPLANLMSSNYPSANAKFQSTSQWAQTDPVTCSDDEFTYGVANTDGVEYFQDASTADLTSIFDAIASQSGGSTNTSLSESTSTVDIVSSSFMLPANATKEDIKVFTAPCTGKDGDVLQFDEETLAPYSDDKYDKYKIDENGTKTLVETDVDVDKDIAVVIGTDANNNPSIEVTGFDYSNNWCGSVTSGSVVTYQGHKVIILIPVQMNPDAVGGPNVETNAAGSGIYVNGDDDEPLITFDSPTVSLPVNIHIEKTGLEKGESAKFTIQRTTLPMSDSSTWEYVTSVFVTCTSTETDPIVKVRGLPSTNDSGVGFVYRVIEEGWSWSYDPDEDTYIQYTNTSKVDNPFTFNNTKKENIDTTVRHAESKATNIFNNGGSVVYNDSKNNGR